ncbi:uncharacterized protein LOC103931781 [Pyrus x bretschneideri]|uniref:uncharacterized protein LOC103931781 n=1 Tax=Pyrus x bretschneideri TaxID=225117 RepID=UPI0005109225|nr:uncharacterized protein LOC103931781 [Pyrus x bretschneideri]
MARVMACEPTEEQPQWGGSVAGRSYKPQIKHMSHDNLMNNYFNPNLMYKEEDFRRHFQMRRHVQHVNPYFQQKLDKASCPGFSLHQKVTIALLMMAYTSPSDAMNDTYGMTESTCLDTLAEFYDTIIHLYKEEYLRESNQEDLDRLIRKAEDRALPSMIWSLDCMH